MSPEIQLQNQQSLPVDEKRLRAAACAALSRRSRGVDVSLSIVLSDSDTLRRMNEAYREYPAASDILSFPAAALPAELRLDKQDLGDIIIAIDLVAQRCHERACSLPDVLCLLVVHAVLHLLGYDHDSPQGRARMWAAQSKVLKDLRIAPDLLQRYSPDA